MKQTVEEHLRQLGENGNKIIGYAVVNAISGILNEAAEEIDDAKLSEMTSQIEEHIDFQLEKILSQRISILENGHPKGFMN